MYHGISSRLALGLSAALMMISGCSGPEDASSVGTARVRIEAARTENFEISRVTISAQGGFESELARDDSGAFIGTLSLPAGPNELVGLAFAGNELVGVSNPVPVEIQSGFVTGVTIRIIDITGGQDIEHRPIVLSLTHPLSAVTNHPVELAVSAVDPDGDAIGIDWSSECADAVIFSPNSAVTSIVKATPGSCRVNVTVSDGALSTTESFFIVVFDENQVQGAVNVHGEFVSAPQLFLEATLPGNTCSIFSNSPDGTCSGSIASPSRAPLNAFVNWGSSQPGALEVVDNCGGIFESTSSTPFFFSSNWLPPSLGFDTVCLITARAFSNDGVYSQISAAVLVRPGVPPQPVGPNVYFSIDHPRGICEAPGNQSEVFCQAPVVSGDLVNVLAIANWGNQPVGFLSIFDTCGGAFLELSGDGTSLDGRWQAPPFDTQCDFFAQAFGQDMTLLTSVVLHFPVLRGQPPGGM